MAFLDMSRMRCKFMGMKSALWIVPALLAACIGFWLFNTGFKVKELQSEVGDMKKQLGGTRPAAVEGSVPQMDGERGSATSRVIGPNDKLNWKSISSLMTAMEGDSTPQLQKSLEGLQARLETMDKAALHEALDEIAAMGLSAEERGRLEVMVVEQLMPKDAKGVLQRFDDRIGNDDDSVGWLLSEALGQWAQEDPVAACRWMDERIKAGKFDSKSLDGYSSSRVEFESALMFRLLGEQNKQAVERIRALPENDRLVVLEQMDLTQLEPEGQIAYAEILRTLVPESSRQGSFGYVASELSYDGGYEAVDAFLDRVKAGAQERAEAASQTAFTKITNLAAEAKPTVADIESMRDWVRKQVPEQVDHITGQAIGEAYDQEGFLNFEEARKLVMEFYGKSGNDEIIAGFLESFACQENPAEARKLVDLIKNPEKRQQLLEGF